MTTSPVQSDAQEVDSLVPSSLVTLGRMLALQAQQQEFFEGPLPEGRAEQRALAERYVGYMIGEAYEYLNAIAYKKHIPTGEQSYNNRLLEWVDMFKYLLAIAWTEGFSAQEIRQAFDHKTSAVFDRHKREVFSERVAAFDIDGVLANIESGGYSRDWPLEQQDEWMAAGGVARLRPYQAVVEVVRELKAQGWAIVLVTSRKRHRHQNIEHETYSWLRQHGIPCDLLLFGYDKSETMAEAGIRPAFYVEDTAKHALDVASWGVPVYYLGQGLPPDFHPAITTLDRGELLRRTLEGQLAHA